MTAIFKRELRGLLTGLWGWVYAALVLAVAGVCVFINNVSGASPLFAGNALYVALGMALGCALITMNAFPGERRENTERLLYALPVRSHAIILGKLLSRLVPVLASCVILLAYPLLIGLFSATPAIGEGLSCVLALAAMSVMFTAMGLFCSACARTSIAALLGTLALIGLGYAMPYAAAYVSALTSVTIPTLIIFLALMIVLFYLLSNDLIVGFIAGAIIEAPVLLLHLQGNDAAIIRGVTSVMKSASLFDSLSLFMNGIFDISALIYWLTIACLFAVLAWLAVVARRQSKRRAL